MSMNLMSSKLLKSNRQQFNRSAQTTTAYSCEMYLESFKITHRGYVYFIWYTNETQISSLRYESNGSKVHVKETLTISIRVPTKNGKEVPTNSYLKLMSEEGQELDEYEIPINNLTPQFKDLEIPIDRGLCIIKARKKNMNILDTPQQNSIMKGGNFKSKRITGGGGISVNHSLVSGGQFQSLQEQLNRVKKQLEDQVYLNNKLRNDRDVLMATKQDLQLELENLMNQATRQIQMLKEYSQNRISIREHCYQEEIQNLISKFNSDASYSKKIMESILRQKNKLQDEAKLYDNKIKKYEEEAQKRIEQLQSIQSKIDSKNQYIRKADTQIQIKIREIDIVTTEKNQLKSEMEKQIQGLEGQLQGCNVKIKNLEDANTEWNYKYQLLQNELKEKDYQIQSIEDALKCSKQKQQGYIRQNDLMRKQNTLLDEQKNHLIIEIEELKARLQQRQYEMEFNENVIAQLKMQQQQKEQELYTQLENIQKIYQKKIEDLMAKYEQQRGKLEETSVIQAKEKLDLESKLKQLESIYNQSEMKIIELTKQIQDKSNEVKQNKQIVNEKLELIQKLQAEIKQLKQKLNQLVAKHELKINNREGKVHQEDAIVQTLKVKINTLENENKKLKEELGQVSSEAKSAKEQMNSLKKQNQYGSEVNRLLEIKELQLNQLKKQIETMEQMLHVIQSKLDKIIEIYPNVDMEKVNAQLPIIEQCDSEIEEEIQLNKQASIQAKKQYGSVQTPGSYDNKMMNSPALNKRFYTEVEKPGSENNFDTKIKIEEQSNQTSIKINNNKFPKRFPSAYRDNVSEKSGTSYIKVSHSKKIKGLEQQVQQLRKKNEELQQKIKELSKRESKFKIEISEHQRIIQVLKGQILELNMSQSMIPPEDVQKKMQPSSSSPSFLQPNQPARQSNKPESFNQDKRLQHPKSKQYDMIETFKPDSQNRPLEPSVVIQRVQKVSSSSQVFMQDERMKQLLKQSMIQDQQLKSKATKISQLQQEINQAIRTKNEQKNRFKVLEQAIGELENKQKDLLKYIDELLQSIKQLQKKNSQLQQLFSKQKQNAQSEKLAFKQLSIHFQNSQNQLKKYRNLAESLEQKVQKSAGNDLIIRQLQKQIEDMTKKNLDLIRTINHLKLQKDATQEELRLIKKRQSDQSRIASQWEEKSSSLERIIQEMKRKENKLKREIEDTQEQVRRSKLQQKKLEDELQALSSAQIGWQVERRKYLDEISNLQDHGSRKDYQITKLQKQIDRWKSKVQQRQDIRYGRKNELRQQIQRLQNELIRREKRVFEEAQQNKLLKGRLDLLERQNKRILEQKNQNYGEKLRYYVEEMANIKKLLDEYQNENSRLKIDNNQLYQQSEMVRTNYEKLQLRYDQNIGRQEDILHDLQMYIDQNNLFKDRLSDAHNRIKQLEDAYINLRKQNDGQKNFNKKNSQKIQILERLIQNNDVQIRDYKIKLSEYQTNSQINGKIAEKYRNLQKRYVELQEQYKKIKTESEHLATNYQFKRQDLQNAVNQARNQERRLKQEEIHRMEQQYNKAIASKTQRLEQQLLDLYNENNRIRSDLQAALEENGRSKGRLIELEMLCEKVNALQSQNQLNKITIQELRDQIRKRNDRLSKNQISLEGLQSQNNLKVQELTSLKIKIKQFQDLVEKLNNQIKNRKNAEKDLQQALIRASDKTGKQRNDLEIVYKQRENQLISDYESKLNSLDIQLKRMKQKQARAVQDNTNKMKTLEKKMDEMEDAMKEKQKAIQIHYESQINGLQNSLFKLSDQLKEKHSLINQLNQAILVLEGDNVELSKQLQDLNFKHNQDRQLLQNQLNKLKNKMKQTENAYNTNIKTLEDQLVRAVQPRINTTNSRLRSSEVQDRVSKRYQDKLKNKEKKIQQLKDTIYTLEETIMRLKKKESGFESSLTQIEKLKVFIVDLEKQKKQSEGNYQNEISKYIEQIRQLKKSIFKLRQQEQKNKLIAQQKILQNQSLESQLKTIRQLYTELQKQLERRKNALSLQLQEEGSHQYQVRLQQIKISELEERLIEYLKTIKQFQLTLKRRDIEIKKNQEHLEQYHKHQIGYKEQISRQAKEINQLKESLQDVSTSCESINSELKFSKAQINRLKKLHEDLKVANINKQEVSSELKRINDELVNRFRAVEDLARRYEFLNDRSKQQIGCSIQQLISKYSILAEEKDVVTNELIEQIQELKFLNERKFMDYDEMKKTVFELQLKVEESETLSDQLETLRKVCDKLEDEKKNAVFRQEVLRMHIQNLGVSSSSEVKAKINSILNTPIVPSYTNFSFY